MNIPSAQWKDLIVGAIDSLERTLPFCSAPKAAKLQLSELRECASKASSAKARKSCERRLDRLFESAHMKFRSPKRKGLIVGAIDSLERQLPSSAPKAARLQLFELRECASKASSAKARKSCERRLDRLVESSPCVRGAYRRYVGEHVDSAIDVLERAMETLIEVARAQGNRKGERGITKLLVDFRKKRRKPIYKPINSIRRT